MVPFAEHFNPIVADLDSKLHLNLPVAETEAPFLDASRETNFQLET